MSAESSAGTWGGMTSHSLHAPVTQTGVMILMTDWPDDRNEAVHSHRQLAEYITHMCTYVDVVQHQKQRTEFTLNQQKAHNQQKLCAVFHKFLCGILHSPKQYHSYVHSLTVAYR